MPAKKRKSSAVRFRPVSVNCPFCRGKVNPDYKNPSELAKYMTDRAKIIPKSRSGLCAKHQRRLSVAIKRARHLAFLPFTGGL
ncbi:30S ribosomal protein S18 [Candidatus Woesebacteria bacterium RIFOXYB1_FULL_47_31]|uniref:Small ribosomal subunit protein bS18 n=4 Tax=Candidatus Woeseibacteriota TaxID=1752722 RepID=A0A1F8D8U7_9BACT|nr:MAG: 30S ribosomal protein S18 [Candidatus Woesebacteria bacterium RIFOXYA1_FULL_48_16]OGM84459.1 MAG: 30S ribosomal protein S18 [Candidatus Woesebacteria bacterium RIFOXYB1_FULL_47_31]OGM84814.1 MAG: 30S ribosomal protein S18 [Candidatus Woesebacteria bacterium RIFOXYC1_FULL_46_16]OGM89223.1 MAG: 30S ribosomal protein S18 [Candidatus Woesebacteria bacterium RIFOXYD1_FULL_46_19]